MKESHRGGTGSWCCFLEGFQKEAQAGAAMTASSLQTGRCSPVTPTGEKKKKKEYRPKMKLIKPTFDYSDNAQDHNDNLLLDSDSSI